MSVIVSRALPDVRDGLKPVQRRILYAMQIGYSFQHAIKRVLVSLVSPGNIIPMATPPFMTLCSHGSGLLHALPLIDGQGNSVASIMILRLLCVTPKPAWLLLLNKCCWISTKTPSIYGQF